MVRLTLGRRDSILLCLFPGPFSYIGIMNVTGLQPAVLDDYLIAMEREDMVRITRPPGSAPAPFQYALTKKGLALVPPAK